MRSFLVTATVVFLNVLNVIITCFAIGIGLPALHRRAVAASAVVMMIAACGPGIGGPSWCRLGTRFLGLASTRPITNVALGAGVSTG